MKPDLYTKSVLTIIAVSLLWLCVQTPLRIASAQGPGGIQKITLVDEFGKPYFYLPAGEPSPGLPIRLVAVQPIPVSVGPRATDPFGSNYMAIPVTGSVAIDGPVTVRQGASPSPKAAPPAPSKK